MEIEDGETELSEERFRELQKKEEFLLTVTVGGFGKRTSAYEYRVTGRGGQGVIGIQASPRNGAIVGAVQVFDGDEIMLISDKGTLVRTRVDEISVQGRNTQGVRLIRVESGERLVGLAKIEAMVEEE